MVWNNFRLRLRKPFLPWIRTARYADQQSISDWFVPLRTEVDTFPVSTPHSAPSCCHRDFVWNQSLTIIFKLQLSFNISPSSLVSKELLWMFPRRRTFSWHHVLSSQTGYYKLTRLSLHWKWPTMTRFILKSASLSIYRVVTFFFYFNYLFGSILHSKVSD